MDETTTVREHLRMMAKTGFIFMFGSLGIAVLGSLFPDTIGIHKFVVAYTVGGGTFLLMYAITIKTILDIKRLSKKLKDEGEV